MPCCLFQKIALTASDYPRLKQLARLAAQKGDLDGIFLMGEVNRADIISDDLNDVRSRVTLGSWVTYSANCGVPRRTVQLVWPEQSSLDLASISVLTPLGSALIGLQVDDQMPYFIAGCLNVVRVQNISPSDSMVVPLVRRKASMPVKSCDDDPGPAAA